MTRIVVERGIGSTHALSFNAAVRRRFTWVLAGCTALAGATALLWFPTPRSLGLSLSIVLAVVALALVRWERRRWGTLGLGSPLALTSIAWFLYFGIAGLGAFAPAVSDPRLGFEPMNLVGALGICILSLILVAAGYRLATRALSRPSPGPGGLGPLAVKEGALYLLLAFAWVARLSSLESGRYGIGDETGPTGLANRLVQLTADGLTIALVVLVIAAWSPAGALGISKGKARWLLAANLVPLAFVSLASGFKAQLFTEVVPLIVAYLMVRGRVPWRWLAAVLVYLVVVYSGVESYRDDIQGGRYGRQERVGVVNAVSDPLGNVVEGWISETPIEHAQSFWRHFTDEYSTMLRNLAVILHRTPEEVPHLGNRRLVTGPVFFLPTSALGDAELSLGRYVNVVYLNSTSTSSSPPTQPGDFYMSGGWSTVVVGQFLVGLFMGGVWRLTVLRRDTVLGVVVYATASAAFVGAGLDWGGLTRGLLQSVGAAWLTMVVIRRRQPARVRT